MAVVLRCGICLTLSQSGSNINKCCVVNTAQYRAVPVVSVKRLFLVSGDMVVWRYFWSLVLFAMLPCSQPTMDRLGVYCVLAGAGGNGVLENAVGFGALFLCSCVMWMLCAHSGWNLLPEVSASDWNPRRVIVSGAWEAVALKRSRGKRFPFSDLDSGFGIRSVNAFKLFGTSSRIALVNVTTLFSYGDFLAVFCTSRMVFVLCYATFSVLDFFVSYFPGGKTLFANIVQNVSTNATQQLTGGCVFSLKAVLDGSFFCFVVNLEVFKGLGSVGVFSLGLWPLFLSTKFLVIVSTLAPFHQFPPSKLSPSVDSLVLFEFTLVKFLVFLLIGCTISFECWFLCAHDNK